MARASQFAAIPDYLETANQEICLLLQVDSKATFVAVGIDVLVLAGGLRALASDTREHAKDY